MILPLYFKPILFSSGNGNKLTITVLFPFHYSSIRRILFKDAVFLIILIKAFTLHNIVVIIFFINSLLHSELINAVYLFFFLKITIPKPSHRYQRAVTTIFSCHAMLHTLYVRNDLA